MKSAFKTSVALALIAAGIMAASLAMAGVGNVSNTVHNFSPGGYSAQLQSTRINEVCKFCHTPHNAGKNRLLWNKSNLTAASYNMYTSSKTLSETVRTASSFSPDSPSLLCLGCHDGKTAMNVLHTSDTGVDAGAGYQAGSKLFETSAGFTPLTMQGFLTDGFGGMLPNMNIGGTIDNPTKGNDLTNDHPLGFSYSAVLGEPAAAARLNSIEQVGAKSSNRIKFFGGGKKVECSTCHDPHVDSTINTELKPFLVMSNSGSAICLSCHNK